ncbi:hypothetical protein SAMN04489727_1727 [Amycolatopsis tolypomycina]|uniref:Phage tail tube protein n=1 Tax=Amycolatopsis tolypomycina TaxID=208445 RepID=A0A1H4JC85_9PSEU|nr:hypothetical protein [Amycolatopsis tolypomycina]SEB43606.1 hypothetical protein SAMN04489727_1727 [Amycolatopsis tolypomycina]
MGTKTVLLAAYVNVNSTDLSQYGCTAELPIEVAAEDGTTFGSGGWEENVGGLKSGSMKVKFKQSVTATELDSIMWPLLGTVVPFELRVSQAAVGASNPKYTGSVLISKWTPISGDVGKILEVDVEWPTSGAVARAVV